VWCQLGRKDVDVFRRPAKEALPFELVQDDVTCQHIDAKKPPYLRLGEPEAGHFAILGLNNLDEPVDAWLQ
jgi:hypothetical protein